MLMMAGLYESQHDDCATHITRMHGWIKILLEKNSRAVEPNIGLTVTVAPNKGCLKTPAASGLVDSVSLIFFKHVWLHSCRKAGMVSHANIQNNF